MNGYEVIIYELLYLYNTYVKHSIYWYGLFFMNDRKG